MASSSLTINFSLRQNKAIERAIAFDALSTGRHFIGDNPVYVGLGSLWFQDFQMAHRILGVETMVSIEGDEAIFKRADFNRPFRTIEVVHGYSNVVVPELLERADISARPWIAWLDYDRYLTDERLDELSALVMNANQGSVLLTTFNANPENYGNDTDARRLAATELLGTDYVAAELPDEAFDGARLMRTLADGVLAYLAGLAIREGREGPFLPAVRLLYRDSTYMATVGGFLPRPEDADLCEAMVADGDWCGFEDAIIETHPLTLRELLALSRLMPSPQPLDTADVAALGFELDEEQIRFYEKHYGRYPAYAELR